jgi:hypothetical protein
MAGSVVATGKRPPPSSAGSGQFLGPDRLVPRHGQLGLALGLAESQRMTYVHRRAMLTPHHQANWHGKTSLTLRPRGTLGMRAARERIGATARKADRNRKFSFLKIEPHGRASKEHTTQRLAHDGVLPFYSDFRGHARCTTAHDVTQSGAHSCEQECAKRGRRQW